MAGRRKLELHETVDYERAMDLLPLLTEYREGLTVSQVVRLMDWTETAFYKAVQILRDILADEGDSFTVINEYRWRAPHVYRLHFGSYVMDTENGWLATKDNDVQRRIKTLKNIMKTAVGSTDGRTREGRAARDILMYVTHAEEVLMRITE